MDERPLDDPGENDAPNAQIAVVLCVILAIVFWGLGLMIWGWDFERTPDCEAQDATLYASSACGVDDTYVWTGKSCTFHCGSLCEGSDCRRTFDDRISCEETYAHCIDD